MSFDGKRLVQPFAAARPLTVIEVNSTSQAIGWSLDLSSLNGIRPCYAAARADAIISYKIFCR